MFLSSTCLYSGRVSRGSPFQGWENFYYVKICYAQEYATFEVFHFHLNLRVYEQPRKGFLDENVWSAWVRVVTSCYGLFVVLYDFVSTDLLIHSMNTSLSKGSSFPSHPFQVFSSLLSSDKFIFPQNFNLRPLLSKPSSPLHFSLPTLAHATAFSFLWEKTASGSWEFLEDLSQTILSTRKSRKARKQLIRLNHELTKEAQRLGFHGVGTEVPPSKSRRGQTQKSQYNR